jgi:ABC-2 type transport system ATP-binding protein
LLIDVGLKDALDRKVGGFSKGMLQLLGIAQTMIGKTPVYILDEPMAGLDPRWVKIIRDKILKLNEEGATIIFSSHILSEVQNLCDKVVIINKGKIIVKDTVENLNKYLKIKPRLEITITGLNGKIPEIIKKIHGIESIDIKEDVLLITCDSAERINIISTIKDKGFNVKDIKTIEPSLEEAFMKIITKDDMEET